MREHQTHRHKSPAVIPSSTDQDLARHRIARQVARATGTFEHLLTGRAPHSVTVVCNGDWLVVSLHGGFSALERRLAAEEEGASRVRDFHHYLFDNSLDSIRSHVRRSTGVELRGAIAHVDPGTGSVIKTFTTNPAVELFLLGQGLPVLGVPVNAHLHADGVSGNGAVRS
jgi:uncharacterized protein YbcI